MAVRYSRVPALLLLSCVFAFGAGAAGIENTYTKPAGSSWAAEAFARLFGREAFGKSYAIVIGVGDYDQLPRLSAPAADAFKVRDFLRDEAGFDTIVTLTDDKATPGRINDLMEKTFPTIVSPNDRFLFYFSGHGITRHLGAGRPRGYLVLKQASQTDWPAMIDMPRIRQWAENLGHARHALFILDACFSGLTAWEAKSTPREKTIERLMQPGHHIVTAGVEGEESYIYKGESLFTQAFLSAARGEGAAGEDVVSLNEIMARVNRTLDARRADIGERIKMTPRLYNSRIENNAGEFFFLPRGRVDSLARVPPAPLTPEAEVDVKGLETDQPSRAPVAPSRNDIQARLPARSSNEPAARTVTNGAFAVRRAVEARGNPDLAALDAGSIGKCEQICDKSATCNFFTYGKTNGACYLYSHADLQPSEYFDTGIRVPTAEPVGLDRDRTTAGPFKITGAMEAVGNPSTVRSGLGSMTACESVCASSATCNFFSYGKTNGACYLYSDADLQPNERFDTGIRLPTAEPVSLESNRTITGSFEIKRAMEAMGDPYTTQLGLRSMAACESICASSGACNFFTYSIINGACYLYSRADLQRNEYFYTGVRQSASPSAGPTPQPRLGRTPAGQ